MENEFNYVTFKLTAYEAHCLMRALEDILCVVNMGNSEQNKKLFEIIGNQLNGYPRGTNGPERKQ